MSIHVLEDRAFFRASIPVADQQRLVLLPGPRSVAAGDELFLRSAGGEVSWVADVLMVQSTGGAQAWEKQAEEAEQPYIVAGWLAKVHPGTLPMGAAHLAAPWVTLNSRTLDRALPWREGGHLVYHHTLHLVESVLTDEEFEQAQVLGIIAEHRSGHWFFPMGDARKRFLVQVRREPLLCALCGTAIPSLEECTQDHRIPSSQGGPDVLGNLQLAHKICNEVKGNALPEQYPPVFLPPGAEEDRAGSRRGHRRSSAQRLPVPVLTPVAAAGGVAAAAVAGNVAAALLAVNGNGSAAAGRPVAAPATGKAQPAVVAAEAAPEETKSAAKTARTGRRGAKSRKAAAKEPVAAEIKVEAAVAEDVAVATASTAAATTASPVGAAPAAKGKARTRTRKTKSAKTTSRTADAEVALDAAVTVAATAPETVEVAAGSMDPLSGQVLEGLSAPEEWLHKVQASGWQELAALATMPDWAARTATLRTICALRRNQVQRALADGQPIAEATGKEGRFALLTWNDQHILVEEKGSRRHVHQVHMLQGLAPEVYVWWLSEFGRTAPLGVAMSLLSLWQSGAPDAEGRVNAKKGSQRFTLRVSGDRLIDCRRASSDTAVA